MTSSSQAGKNPRKSGRTPTHDRHALAVVHGVGDTVRVLVVDVSQSPIQMRDARSVAAADSDGIAQILQSHRVGRVFVVVPAGDVICRNCTLPAADPDQLAQALGLQAEAALLGVAPDHRVAQAVLDPAPGETSRNGLVVAWPETSNVPAVDLPQNEHLVVTHAPDVAGVAALLDGLRPSEPVLWIDRPSSGVAAAITHSGGAVFRSVRESADTTPEWVEAVARTLAETALNVGHTGAFIDGVIDDLKIRLADIGADDTALVAPPEIIARGRAACAGAPDDPAWWNEYGIAAGVAIAATSSLGELCLLEAHHADAVPGRFSGLLTALAEPRVAVRTVLICLGLIALLPLLSSGARLGLLSLRHDDLGAELQAVRAAHDSVRMYEALDASVWPMAKIISDITSNTPQGIELTMIRLSQAEGGFAIAGTAVPHDGKNATEVIQLMHDQLVDSGVFADVGYSWGDPNAYQHYEFDLTAKVRQPHRAVPYADDLDFAAITLSDRLYGPGDGDETAATRAPDPPPSDGALVTTAPPDPPPSDSETTTGRTRSTGRARATGTAAGTGADRGDATERSDNTVAEFAIPEALTQAQVDAMSIEEVRQQLSVVSAARRRVRSANDEVLEARLKAEFDMLMARLREGF